VTLRQIEMSDWDWTSNDTVIIFSSTEDFYEVLHQRFENLRTFLAPIFFRF